MMTTRSKLAVGATGLALLLGSQFYGDWSARSSADSHFIELQQQVQALRAEQSSRVNEVSAQLELVQSRIGVNAEDTAAAQKQVALARQEQARAAAALRNSLEQHAREVAVLKEESGVKLDEIRQQASTQIDEVSGAVNRVAGDVSVVRDSLAESRREIGDVRDSLGRQIAHNADELSLLKLRGERDYYEFDIRKNKEMQRVAGLRVQLNKADMKARKYDVTLQVDDNKLQKKGQLLNEPVQLLVGKDRLRYELVVNFIDKDRIRGYVSTPKDIAPNRPVALGRLMP